MNVIVESLSCGNKTSLLARVLSSADGPLAGARAKFQLPAESTSSLYVLSRHIVIDIEYRSNAYTNNLCCFSNNSKTNNDTPPHLIPYWTLLLRQHQQHLFIMKIILTGSTGFIGGEVLAQCLKNPAITLAVVLSRRELSKEISDPRLKVIIMKSFTQYPDSVLKELAGADACIWYISLVLLNSKFFSIFLKIDLFTGLWARMLATQCLRSITLSLLPKPLQRPSRHMKRNSAICM